MLRRVIGVLIGVAALAAIANGCGGSDGSSLTRAEFVKQGDAICVSGEEKKAEGVAKAFRTRKDVNQKKVQEELVTDVALPPYIEMTEELKDLGAPEGAEDLFDELIAGLEEQNEDLESKPSIALDPNGSLYDKADKAAKEIGMKECSDI